MGVISNPIIVYIGIPHDERFPSQSNTHLSEAETFAVLAIAGLTLLWLFRHRGRR